MKKLLLLTLCALLTATLFGCAPSAPKREHVTEDAPVRNPDEVYTETLEEKTIGGSVEAICGEDLIRISLFQVHREEYGDEIYVRIPPNADTSDYCQSDRVDVTFDTIERSTNPDDLPIIIAKTLIVHPVAAKPVIYLYPEAPTEVSVTLTLNGRLTCTYPDYEDGWNGFTAHPDGTLIAPDGKEYYCLYWEGKQNTVYDFSRGFCVKGEDTAAFLEWALAAQGLTPREANEFIIYWLPRMEQNPYNVISFQTTAYTDTAVLEVAPAPDTLIRVFMAWYPSEKAVNIPAQSFEPVERSGFTVVEWGGSERNHRG